MILRILAIAGTELKIALRNRWVLIATLRQVMLGRV